ncbi:glucosamine--fructose-6-phosphate aminotransferase [isomerizing] [Clostridium sp. CAG:628]|nr:glucosamine--fructose-6-phosphate aminotransferase [isomerizing] [Clostridium sp. CAG:628]
MCGIIGYVGEKRFSIDVIIDGLKHLEYRGYDSAGIAYVKDNNVVIEREVGRISNLESVLKKDTSHIGIGHTRWATHGKPTKENAHPHKVGNITLVHNGIIDNFMELKSTLMSEDYTFKSDTDTEVATAYIDSLYKENNDMIKSLSICVNKFLGSYAFGIINELETDVLYALRKDSPLIIGVGENENFIASDVPSILKYTNKYIDIENDEIVKITKDKVTVYDKNCNIINKEISVFEGDANLVEKNGYETYMLKEIHEEAEVIKKTSEASIDFDITKYDEIDIVACGSAYHAGLVGKYMIEKLCNIKVNVCIASEYQYDKHFYKGKTLVIAISQSGETADTKKCVNIANDMGVDTLGIVNVKGSSIARICKHVIYTLAGPEIAVATTKAYLAQITTLILLAVKNSKEMVNTEDLQKLPYYIETLINKDYTSLANMLMTKDDIYFIGRGIDYALCMEGSLKLKEISYIHSEAYAAGELKHGTISLISEGTPVIVVATSDVLYLKTISNAKEVKARGAYVILVTDKEVINEGVYDKLISIPKVIEELRPILTIIPLQLISYEVAKLRGNDIDKPKNLAKSVTVE